MAPLVVIANTMSDSDSGDSSHDVRASAAELCASNDGNDSGDSSHNNHTNNNNSSVRFVSFLQHRIIPPSRDYSEEEVQAAWYSRAELAVIKKERHATMRLLNGAGDDGAFAPDASSELCGDGLLTEDENCLRSTTISEALDSVLSEQEAQMEEEGAIDHDMIADVYFEACCFSESQALERGMRVAREVKQMLNLQSSETSSDHVPALTYEASNKPIVAQSKSFGRTRRRRITNPSKVRSLPKTYMNQTRPKIYQPPRITHTIHDI